MTPYKNEVISLMEPMLIPERLPERAELVEMAFTVVAEANSFHSGLPESIRSDVAGTVRSMNCYYSNLIEGHNTHPISIEKALTRDLSAQPKQRNLQLEANAHILAQGWIDAGGLLGRELTTQGIRELHKKFCDNLPIDLLLAEDPTSGKKSKVVPGEYRKERVIVGEHVAIAPEQIATFMQRFESVYAKLTPSETIVAAAAAHHRLLWIHPFLDGNGRVARLMSHAALMRNLNGGGLWSIARGLARTVTEYKSLLHNCDLQRRADTDGRGNLSQKHLIVFTKYFLNVCLDQIRFMRATMKPDELSNRVIHWASTEISAGNLPDKATRVLEALLYKGQLTRGEIPQVLNVSDRHARRITASLEKIGAVHSDTDRSPYRLQFPYRLSRHWMPGLYPELPEYVDE